MRINTYTQSVLSWLSIIIILSYTACQDSTQIEKGIGLNEPRPQVIPSTNLSNDQNYHQAPLTALTFISPFYILGHDNGAISIWKSPLQPNQKAALSFLAHEQNIRSLNPLNTNSFRSLSADGSWAEWNLEGRVLRRGRIKDSSPNVMLSRKSNTDSFSFFGDARGTVTAMKGRQRLWRTAGEHGRAVFGLALYDKHSLLSVGSDGWARCWLIKNGQSCGALALHQAWITKLSQFNNNWLTTGSDGVIRLWPKNLFLSPQGSQPSTKAKAELKVHSKNITQVTSYGDLILSGDDSGKLSLSRWDEEYGTLQRVWQFQDQNLAPIRALVINPQQGQILLGGGTKKQLYVYSLNRQLPQDKQTHDEANSRAQLIIQF